MALTNMAMKPIDLRIANFIEDTEEGTDYLIEGWRFAHRQRNISIQKYGQISIRYSTQKGNDTEYHKLLSGRFQAVIYMFEFTDAIVICSVADIKDCLLFGKFDIVPNPDSSKGCYINLNEIKHIRIDRTG